MDGVETTARLRGEGDEYYKNVPIIALTANATSGMREMFLENGFDDFVSKPTDMNTLNEKLEKWISQNESVSEINKEIHGIDMEAALSLYNGDEDLFKEILQLFVEDVPAELDKLRGVSTENLKNYAIDVHTVKGVAAGIGATELNEFAARMEKMAKDGDFDGVSAENERLINEAESLVTRIVEWLKTQSGGFL
jgi:HPt (histidine-containing phosphotransfer) domain-containing protein